MSFLRGIPLDNYFAFGIQDLDVCAFNLVTADNIRLLDFNMSFPVVYDQDLDAVLVLADRTLSRQ